MEDLNYLDKIKKNTNTIVIAIDESIYSKTSILKGCYKFTDIAYIFIDIEEENSNKKYIIYFQKKEDCNIKNIERDFINELLDQELRLITLKETKSIRDTIVTKALLSGQSNEV